MEEKLAILKVLGKRGRWMWAIDIVRKSGGKVELASVLKFLKQLLNEKQIKRRKDPHYKKSTRDLLPMRQYRITDKGRKFLEEKTDSK